MSAAVPAALCQATGRRAGLGGDDDMEVPSKLLETVEPGLHPQEPEHAAAIVMWLPRGIQEMFTDRPFLQGAVAARDSPVAVHWEPAPLAGSAFA